VSTIDTGSHADDYFFPIEGRYGATCRTRHVDWGATRAPALASRMMDPSTVRDERRATRSRKSPRRS